MIDWPNAFSRPALQLFALERVRPHDLYTVIAALFGLVFVFLTPPSGAGDEPRHFERMFEVATGQWLGAQGLPRGVIAFTDLSKQAVENRAKFDAARREALAAIPLDDADIQPYPRPLEKILRIHHPAAYLPFAPAIWIGSAFDLPPYTIFVLCKLTTLALGLFLMRQAIRILPNFKLLATFIALLPTTVFYLGAANIDAFLTGFGFLFFALVVRAAARGNGAMTGRDIALLASAGAAVAVIKAPYAFLPLLAVLIPADSFKSPRQRAGALAAIILPGIAFALSWALLAKTHLVPEGAYSTPGGTYVLPAEQMARLIAYPPEFLAVLWRTAFESSVPATILGQALGLLGWNNVPLPPWTIALSMTTLILLWFGSRGEKSLALCSNTGRIVTSALFGGVVTASLFLLYVQWTGVGAPTVEGFQGRYLLPIAPLLFPLAPLRLSAMESTSRQLSLVGLSALATLTSGVAAVFAHFY